jgi:hypothetical protein
VVWVWVGVEVGDWGGGRVHVGMTWWVMRSGTFLMEAGGWRQAERVVGGCVLDENLAISRNGFGGIGPRIRYVHSRSPSARYRPVLHPMFRY